MTVEKVTAPRVMNVLQAHLDKHANKYDTDLLELQTVMFGEKNDDGMVTDILDIKSCIKSLADENNHVSQLTAEWRKNLMAEQNNLYKSIDKMKEEFKDDREKLKKEFKEQIDKINAIISRVAWIVVTAVLSGLLALVIKTYI